MQPWQHRLPKEGGENLWRGRGCLQQLECPSRCSPRPRSSSIGCGKTSSGRDESPLLHLLNCSSSAQYPQLLLRCPCLHQWPYRHQLPLVQARCRYPMRGREYFYALLI
ncbi:hypothetical protein Mapa_013849 [Marchantia paleacea]|nr:hypothetical protein Mapa_013849 [Marchantia paleacea]